jgi:hypothetical protein
MFYKFLRIYLEKMFTCLAFLLLFMSILLHVTVTLFITYVVSVACYCHNVYHFRRFCCMLLSHFLSRPSFLLHVIVTLLTSVISVTCYCHTSHFRRFCCLLLSYEFSQMVFSAY